jgi:hypothetical protein
VTCNKIEYDLPYNTANLVVGIVGKIVFDFVTSQGSLFRKNTFFAFVFSYLFF